MVDFGAANTYERERAKDKECIRMALQGKVACKNENGDISYASVSHEECEKLILQIFDEVVFNGIECFVVCKAYEEYIKKKYSDDKIDEKMIHEILQFLDMAKWQNCEYQFETTNK